MVRLPGFGRRRRRARRTATVWAAAVPAAAVLAAAYLVAAFLAADLALAPSAEAQSASQPQSQSQPGSPAATEPAYLDAAERAERDWAMIAESADALLERAEAALGAPVGGVGAVAAAAAVGGFLGALLRGGRRRGAAAPESPSAPAKRGRGSVRRRAAAERAAGREPRREGDAGGAESLIFRGEAAAAGATRPAPGPATGSGARAAASPGAEAAAEGAALFDFFETRFGVHERSAAAAAGYLERLSEAVDALQARLQAAETRAEALRRAGEGAGAGTSAVTGAGTGGAPEAARGRADQGAVFSDAATLLKAAGAALRGDPDFADFSAAVGLDDAIRRLAAYRAQLADGTAPPASDLVAEAWPHGVFRAEALIEAYYPADGDWFDLRLGLAAAATGLRLALRREGVDAAPVRLLAPYASALGERWSTAPEALAELGPVRQTVLGPDGPAPGAVVDVESFGYVDHESGAVGRARLILFDPKAWGQKGA